MNNPDAQTDIFEAAMAALKAEEGERTPACLTEDEMQRLLERRYFLFQRRRIWKHVVSCAYCRQHSRDMQLWLSIPAVGDTPVSAPSSPAPIWSTLVRTRRATVAGTLALAAVALILMFQYRGVALDNLTISERKEYESSFVVSRDSILAIGLDLTDTQRGNNPSERNRYPVRLLRPVGVVVVETRPLLRWQSFPHALSYSFTVRDYMTNKRMVSRDTAQTEYKMSQADTELTRGHLYRWQVIAHLADHSEKMSPNMPFAILDQPKADQLAVLRSRLGNAADAKTHLWLAERFRDGYLLDEAANEAKRIGAVDPLYAKAQALLMAIHRD